MEANNIPIKPMNKKDPQPERSFFVVYPYKLKAPKAPAVMKKTLATDSPVYWIKIEEREIPITAANAQNNICTVLSFIFATPKFSAIMKANGESIIIKANGDAYIAAPKEVIVLVEKSKAKLAVKCANAPVNAKPKAMNE